MFTICHIPEKGFADKYARITSEGVVKDLFSNRNSMTCAYSAYVPALSYDEEEETYVGGFFWDGRVNSLEEMVHFFTNIDGLHQIKISLSKNFLQPLIVFLIK